MKELHRLDKPIAEGAEYQVHPMWDFPQRLLKKRLPDARETPRRSLARYHLCKIAHLLFPDQIPNVYGAGTKPEARLHVERVRVDERHRLRNRAWVNREAVSDAERAKSQIKIDEGDRVMEQSEDYKRFLKSTEECGLFPDTASVNYTKRPDAVMYLDSFTPWLGKGNMSLGYKQEGLPKRSYDPVLLKEAIARRIHDPSLQEKALRHFHRLEQLYLEDLQAAQVHP